MTERPILMSGAMVRAILEGRKTQTRRVVKLPRGIVRLYRPFPKEPQIVHGVDEEGLIGWYGVPAACPYGVPGDRLWVREAWRVPASLDDLNAKGIADAAAVAGWEKPWAPIKYEADGELRTFAEWRSFGSHPGEATPGRYRHARFMPRWACRLVLEVTAVRVERLQEISQHEVFAEGLHNAQQNEIEKQVGGRLSPQDCYRYLWDSLNAKRAPWASNPWVWVVEFRQCAPTSTSSKDKT